MSKSKQNSGREVRTDPLHPSSSHWFARHFHQIESIFLCWARVHRLIDWFNRFCQSDFKSAGESKAKLTRSFRSSINPTVHFRHILYCQVPLSIVAVVVACTNCLSHPASIHPLKTAFPPILKVALIVTHYHWTTLTGLFCVFIVYFPLIES